MCKTFLVWGTDEKAVRAPDKSNRDDKSNIDTISNLLERYNDYEKQIKQPYTPGSWNQVSLTSTAGPVGTSVDQPSICFTKDAMNHSTYYNASSVIQSFERNKTSS